MYFAARAQEGAGEEKGEAGEAEESDSSAVSLNSASEVESEERKGGEVHRVASRMSDKDTICLSFNGSGSVLVSLPFLA